VLKSARSWPDPCILSWPQQTILDVLARWAAAGISSMSKKSCCPHFHVRQEHCSTVSLVHSIEEASASAHSLIWGVWKCLLFSWPVATPKVSEDAMFFFAGVGGPGKASKGEHVTLLVHC